MSSIPWMKKRYAIKCCKDCKPPKRYPGCGEYCEEYKEEKARYLNDRDKEKEFLNGYPVLTNYDFDKNS